MERTGSRIAISVLAAVLASAMAATAAADTGTNAETVSIALSDAYSAGLQSVWMAPLSTGLFPRVEAEWRAASIAIGYVNEPRYGFYRSTGVFTAEIGAGLRAGCWRPRVGLGLAMAAYRAEYRFAGDFLSEYFFLSPLRFSIPLGRSFAVEVSALELRYGPILPGPKPGWNEPGRFFALADAIRIGLRYDIAIGGEK